MRRLFSRVMCRMNGLKCNTNEHINMKVIPYLPKRFRGNYFLTEQHGRLLPLIIYYNRKKKLLLSVSVEKLYYCLIFLFSPWGINVKLHIIVKFVLLYHEWKPMCIHAQQVICSSFDYSNTNAQIFQNTIITTAVTGGKLDINSLPDDCFGCSHTFFTG